MATPLDQTKDFDTPVKKDPPAQPKLVDVKQQAVNVQNGFCLSTFVRVHLERDKKDKATIAFEVSFPLSEVEHRAKGILPKRILQAWEAVEKVNLKRADVPEVDPHHVLLSLTPNEDQSVTLDLGPCMIDKVVISVVEEKGTGDAQEVTRLSFRAETTLDKNNGQWALNHFGHTIWVRLAQIQTTLEI